MLAARSPQAKVVYADGYMLAETSPYGALHYRRNDSYLDFALWHEIWDEPRVMIVNLKKNSGSPLSFVIEWVVGPGIHRMGKGDQFCTSSSSAELMPLIERCSGLVKMRTLNPDETRQIEVLKSEAEGGLNLFNKFY